MHFAEIPFHFGELSLFLLTAFAFLAGFIDAVAGGGGLIQLPALLINLPDTPIATLFGTNKIAALSGTAVSAVQYSKRVKYNYRLLLCVSFAAAIASYAGARVVSMLNVAVLKPIVLIILVVIAIYTIMNRDLGSRQTRKLSKVIQLIAGTTLGLIVGFYDGFFGPGTGSFLVLGFVLILGFEFIEASAYSKVINCVTNISALLVFLHQGNYILPLAIIMALSNIAGSITGTRMAIKRGNRFIRIIFICIVSILIARYAYDIFLA